MTNQPTRLRLFTSIALLLLGTFYPPALLRAQSPAKPPAAAPSGQQEGIKVHGQWTIEVRNPDGKLVSHHEFDNALTADGKESMGEFLRRASKPGEWVIALSHGNFNEWPCRSEGLSAQCVIFEPSTQSITSTQSNAFKNLSIGLQGGNTVVSGTATAAANGKIDVVTTLLTRCPVASTGICSYTGPFYEHPFTSFSHKGLGSEINVVAGQIIQVTVVISFS